jgi:hypothetical protein
MVESEKKKKCLGRIRGKGNLQEARLGIAKLTTVSHTTNTREEHSCPQRGSNPSFHNSGDCRDTP